ncbi:MAG: HAD-IB family phosphatase [Holosporales bacterium]|jgi:HAD superfamily phosphoserine phosphatase-like hydrolase|nr:HAD-IB family phosphatase [Holosporales bacterium]
MNMDTAFCFDLDGTLTKEELLPLIARCAGCHEEINALTRATLDGVIPFESSFKLRCKLLQDVNISAVQSLIAKVDLFEKMLHYIKLNKDICFVITGNLDVWIEPLIKRIGCKFFCSTANTEQDRLIGIKEIAHKGVYVNNLRKRFKKIVAIGDGMGDVNLFEQADYSIAFGAVHFPVQSLIELANYVVFDESALCRLLNTL